MQKSCIRSESSTAPKGQWGNIKATWALQKCHHYKFPTTNREDLGWAPWGAHWLNGPTIRTKAWEASDPPCFRHHLKRGATETFLPLSPAGFQSCIHFSGKKNRFYFINSLHKFLPLLQDWPYSVVSLPPLFLLDKNEPDSSCLFFYDRGIKKLRGRKMLCATDPIRIPLIWPWGTKIAHSIPNALAGKSSATARATHLFTSFQNHNCYFILEEIKGIRLFKTHFNIRKVIKSTSQNLEHLCIFSQQFILILLYESNSPQPYCLIV